MQSRGVMGFPLPPTEYRYRLNRKLPGISEDIWLVKTIANIISERRGDYIRTRKRFVHKSYLGADSSNLSNSQKIDGSIPKSQSAPKYSCPTVMQHHLDRQY